MKRPESIEYSEWYAGYVGLVEETDIISALENQPAQLKELFSQTTEDKALYRYAVGKWTIKEVLGHIIDGERVFAYRAFRLGRCDETPLSGFDENPYVARTNFNERKLSALVQEFSMLRQANMFIFTNLRESDWDFIGVASDAKVSVRALAFIMVGHTRHHLKILKERYFAE